MVANDQYSLLALVVHVRVFLLWLCNLSLLVRLILLGCIYLLLSRANLSSPSSVWVRFVSVSLVPILFLLVLRAREGLSSSISFFYNRCSLSRGHQPTFFLAHGVCERLPAVLSVGSFFLIFLLACTLCSRVPYSFLYPAQNLLLFRQCRINTYLFSTSTRQHLTEATQPLVQEHCFLISCAMHLC